MLKNRRDKNKRISIPTLPLCYLLQSSNNSIHQIDQSNTEFWVPLTPHSSTQQHVKMNLR